MLAAQVHVKKALKPLKFERKPRGDGSGADATVDTKAKVAAATAAGGVKVRKRTRHPDGRVTDDETGEVVYDPAAG